MSIVLAGNSAVVGSWAGDTQASAGTLDVTTGSEGEPQQLSETLTLIAGKCAARKSVSGMDLRCHSR